MGGDDSQKLLPWRGVHSSLGRKPPAQLRNQHSNSKAICFGDVPRPHYGDRVGGDAECHHGNYRRSLTEQFWDEQPLERHTQAGPRGAIP
jgi:hypothetical protein